MNHLKFAIGIVLFASGSYFLTAVSAEEPPADAVEFFNSKIKPVLVNRCYECHEKAPGEGGLTLSWRTGLIQGGDNGSALTPGKPDDSLLIKAIRYDDEHLQMPPDGKLSKEEIADFEKWVQDGAVWPDEQAPPVDAEAAPLPSKELTEEQRNFWAFQPVRSVEPPAVTNDAWIQSPVDRFILTKLEQRGITPATPADKRTLLRRVTFDLIGLPPTPEEVAAFLADDSPTALATVVDRLLASPQYGERWGRHWLDVVRYADARDLIQLPEGSDFREIWRYRDWVVSCFNRDLPYNQFVERQIAGDLLGLEDQAHVESLVALGMLALADFVPGDVDKTQMIADYVGDQIDVVGKGIMGLTIACARCHDHKFDPISTRDYYAMAGIFFSSRLIPAPEPGNTSLTRVSLITPAQQATIDQDKKRIEELSLGIEELAQAVRIAADKAYEKLRQGNVTELVPKYLRAALDYQHLQASNKQPNLDEMATASGLEAGTLQSWIKYLEEQTHEVLSVVVKETDSKVREQLTDKLSQQLKEVAARRDPNTIQDPLARKLAESELLRFSADDPRLKVNEQGQILAWPDRGGLPDDALPDTTGSAPRLAWVTSEGRKQPVARFEGKHTLFARRSVPPQGSAFIVYRPAQMAPAGGRLLGWEDASVGNHGFGLIVGPDGSPTAILRKNAASGDISTSLPNNSFQMVSVTWGPHGVTMHCHGKETGMNMGIDSVSSAPDISSLTLGGPGSGGGDAERFYGDIAEVRVYSAQLDDAARQLVEEEMRNRWFSKEGAPPLAVEPIDDLYDELLSTRGPFLAQASAGPGAVSEEERAKLNKMREELDALKSKPGIDNPQAVAVQEGGPKDTEFEGFKDAPVFIRGNPAKRGPIVPRGFPRVLAGDSQPKIEQGSGRKELAAWLASEEHPLTARVMVNRLWQQHFGEGLVRTVNNFGVMGERPTHPELLDYLAQQFVKSGWSVKAMHRLILLSSAYQQSCLATPETLAADPENRLLSRANRRRLEAEAIRDSLWMVTGRIDLKQGGPASQETNSPRRSLYLMSVRTGSTASDFAQLFDGANCSAIIDQRNQSVVAPQALFLLNDPQVLELADGLADRVIEEIGDGKREAGIDRLYQLLFSRAPSPEEVSIGQEVLGETPDKNTWSRYCHTLFCTNEFIYVD